MRAHKRKPQHIRCYCARRVSVASGRLKPYVEWPHLLSAEPSPLDFALGVGGVIYPPKSLNGLRDAVVYLSYPPEAVGAKPTRAGPAVIT